MNECNKLESQIIDILHEDSDNMEYYPNIIQKLSDLLTQQLDQIKIITDNSYEIGKKYLSEEITKEEKFNQLSERRVDICFLNRQLKELVLALQDKNISFNDFLLRLAIDGDIEFPEPDNMIIPSIKQILDSLQYTYTDVFIVRQLSALTYRIVIKLLIQDLTPEIPPVVTDNIENEINKLPTVDSVFNLNYTVIPENPNNTHNVVIHLDLTMKENLGG